jgi:formate dehydrogenase beta subunit
MGMGRRTALKVLASTGAAATATATASAARKRAQAPDDAVGMLYDTTRCIGCKACVVACARANDMIPDRSGIEGGLYHAPTDLNEHTRNVIKLHKEGREISYMKSQCMHCIDPACVAACMIGALQKREFGIVTWDVNRCIGCRYCAMGCPFTIPKFEWESNTPRIIKCEMCNHLLAKGGEPACCEVCPREAVVFGKYEDLLKEAHRRLDEHPDRYVPKVYGEEDGGGTQVLYLSHVPFEKLGLPALDSGAVPDMSRNIQHTLYAGFVAPVALYAVLGAMMVRNRRKQKKADGDGESS